ncbi:hypothetical protein FXO38_06503 [Capsicum annuum]|nr:hypothetical protein FXO38_06503 [Capsicum annuum]
MNLGFPIDFDGDKEDDASHRPNASTGEPENATGPTAFIGAFENRNAGAFEAEETESQQTNKQDEYSRRAYDRSALAYHYIPKKKAMTLISHVPDAQDNTLMTLFVVEYARLGAAILTIHLAEKVGYYIYNNCSKNFGNLSDLNLDNIWDTALNQMWSILDDPVLRVQLAPSTVNVCSYFRDKLYFLPHLVVQVLAISSEPTRHVGYRVDANNVAHHPARRQFSFQ